MSLRLWFILNISNPGLLQHIANLWSGFDIERVIVWNHPRSVCLSDRRLIGSSHVSCLTGVQRWILTCDLSKFSHRTQSAPPTSWWSCPCWSWRCSHCWGGSWHCWRCGRGRAWSWYTRTSGSPTTWLTCPRCRRPTPSHPCLVSHPNKQNIL